MTAGETDRPLSRRALLWGTASAAAGGLLTARWSAVRAAEADPLLAGRPLVRFPEKTDLILLTTRPPQLETPVAYFDRAITPNDAFFVRYHVFPIPTSVDLDRWRLRIKGAVDRPLALSMDDLRTKFPRVSVTAVNQCSGNSRGRFAPRVLGGQWGDGAMGNAVWTGARLVDLLKAAGLRASGVDVTFDGLDRPAFPQVPDFVKSLSVGRIMNDPDVLVADEMNGRRLPMLNGFPARLVVPGWFGVYWVKNLSEITVRSTPFDGYWMKTAYRIPDTPCGCVEPGAAPKSTVPITRMPVRSFIAAPTGGARVTVGQDVALKGIAFDGGHGIREVLVSDDGGEVWRRAALGADLGRYSFREWSATWTPRSAGTARLMVRAINGIGESQGLTPLWNPAGYLRNVVESVELVVG
jgi:DMSO/TMAO reductase YedYZ molybdopterin-dependent catalytic subunit